MAHRSHQHRQQQDRSDDPSGGVTDLMSARQGLRAEQAFQSRADHRIEQLRVPPQSIEAEQAVLGGLMLAPDAYDRIADQLVDSDFYRRDHQLIFRAIRELAEKSRPYDAVTLGEWFESQGLGEQVAGGAYLVELASTTPSRHDRRCRTPRPGVHDRRVQGAAQSS